MTAILFVGDVVAGAGRRTFRALVPALREELGADFVVVNGENAAGGPHDVPDEEDGGQARHGRGPPPGGAY